MSVGHYENFPVASILLPRRLRHPVAVIYRFARSADDIADEGDATPRQRLAGLDAYRAELSRIEARLPPLTPLFVQLETIIRRHALPLQPFRDLLDAFSQDVVKTRYAHFGEVMAYCKKSANPVGRLMLALYGETDTRSVAYSDAICSSLQLINFLQDVAIDYQKGRIYLPQDEMAKYHVDEAQIARHDASGLWQPFMLAQIERTRKILQAGAPLGKVLKGRIGLELRMIIMGGATILEKLHKTRGDIYTRRPLLNSADWLNMLYRAVRAN
ncbi:squalene/phytoene synthase [Sulfuriferula plumbiphila]|uniref:Squalene/phytoene synthase n=1 Tax=Sulfuriferula plumbiphila TaxID=171865 RepID=A0A512L816_9PROT|nr:squalene synthase HpnC [Sulfuriferula plumbiphila]BBP04576.1 squalene/phytoene synthase [Sulfuriferula plumbiphila]GEP30602.1 squalene/phytoene synthase [Sulfuriferula plumbiphila]